MPPHQSDTGHKALCPVSPLSASDPPPATDSGPASRTRLSASDPNCSTAKPPAPQLGAAASRLRELGPLGLERREALAQRREIANERFASVRRGDAKVGLQVYQLSVVRGGLPTKFATPRPAPKKNREKREKRKEI